MAMNVEQYSVRSRRKGAGVTGQGMGGGGRRRTCLESHARRRVLVFAQQDLRAVRERSW